MKTAALIVAGGKSERFGGEVPKQFRTLCGRPMLSWCVDSFEKAGSIDNIIVVVAEEYLLYTSEKIIDPYGFHKVTKIVPGGVSRRESVYNGLKALPLSTDFVAIHDGARPLVLAEDINRVVKVAAQERAAILATKAADTVKRVRDSYIISTLERDSLFMAQTPQVFQYDLIVQAHRECHEKGGDESITDDASLVEKRGFKVKAVEPSAPNFKVTTSDDLVLAEAVLKGRVND
ncbi:MAG: 2-C-methyl-D-erythritol 4-phosphate cytidylyltransferase [Candidatus Zixiibacteriota bacterium]